MSGVNLSRMDVSDMLDVIHVIFEDLNSFSSEEDMKSKLKMQELLYETVYGWNFQYKLPPDKKTTTTYIPDGPLDAPLTQDFDDLSDVSNLKPFNPREQQPRQRKKPPTIEEINAKPFNPDDFGGTFLGAPLG